MLYLHKAFGAVGRISTARCESSLGILISIVFHSFLGWYANHSSTILSLISTDHKKVVQEINSVDRVLIVCGESKMTLDAFSILAHDFNDPNYRLQRRSQEDFLQSKHLKSWLTTVRPGFTTTGILVANYTDYGCVDTRDSVFALLYLSRDDALSTKTIRPDYTKSAFEVLLQLLDQKAYGVEDHAKVSYRVLSAMKMVLSIVGGFHLGPLAAEIANDLQLRRLAHAAPTPSSQELVFDHHDRRHVGLHTDVCCRVWEDEAGSLSTSLLVGETPSTQTQTQDSRSQYVERYMKSVGVEIKNPLGTVVAFGDNKVKAGDILLFFDDLGPSGGLIVRPIKHDFHMFVGQVVLSHEIQTCSGIDPESFDRENNDWLVCMSPLDLVLFVAQDMKSEISSSKVGPVMKRTVCLEESAKRLTTNVTSGLDSSFAILSPYRRDPLEIPAIILNPDTIDLS